MPTIVKCIKLDTPSLTLIVIIIGAVLVGILWKLNYMAIVGPVLGALLSVIAVLSNETAKYCSSTSTLELSSLGLKQTVDPGLDVEVFEKTRRISAMVVNSGGATVKDVKAALTIRVRRDGQETHYLGDVLLRKSEFDKYKDQPKSDRDNSIYEILNSPNCRGYLVNEYNPHIIGEMLPWALPERIITRPVLSFNKTIGRRKIGRLFDIANELGRSSQSTGSETNNIIKELMNEFKEGLPLPWPFTDYVHITSISPGQRNRLLIFEYAKLNNDEYLVMPFSEYGAPGPSDPSIRPYRACLKLDKSSELIMKVTVHGEGARSPLEFTLCVTFDKLAKIDDAIEKLKSAKGKDLEQKFIDLLNALNSLICHDSSKRPKERPTVRASQSLT